MSTTVDNRVVEMQFKNADFERGIKQTITSLDSLKKALEINTNTLNMSKVQKEVDSLNLGRVTEAVEALSSRFSNLGIVGMTVMQNLTNKAIGLVEHLGQISISQILTGGKGRAQKVADARFKLDGLLKDAQKVEDVFGQASDAVNDTAFGLDEAVNIAAMLTGSGVDYVRTMNEAGEEVSDLDIALKGIAGAAAMSNSSFEDIGRIFAQVKTAGRLMGQDMMQLQGRTINVTAELAKYLDKTQAEVQEMVHHGEIDFNTFAAAMNDSFGAQAKKSNETLQGVLANTRSALSRIGEIFYSGIIENKDLINFFGDLKNKINDVKNIIANLKTPFKNLMSSLSKLGSAILGLFGEKTSKPFTKFIDIIAAGFNRISNFIDSITKKINNFAEKTGLKKTVEEVKETAEEVTEITQTIRDAAKEIWFGGDDGINKYGNGQTRIERLGKDMYDKVQPYVNAMKQANFDLAKADEIYAATVVDDSEKVLTAYEKGQLARENAIKAQGEASDQRKETEESMKLFEGFGNIIKNLLKVVNTVGKAFKKVFSFKDFKSSIKDIASKFMDFAKAFTITDERAKMMQTAFEGLFSVFKMVGDVVGTLVGSGFSILAKILPTIIDGFYELGDFVGSAIKRFKDFIDSNNLLVRAGRFIVTTFEKISSVLKEFFSRFIQLPAVQKLKEEFIDIYERVGAKLLEWFGKAKDAVGEFFGSIDEGDGSTMDRILGDINTALERFMDLTGKGKDNITKFIGKFKEGGDLENVAINLNDMGNSYEKLKKQGKALASSKNIGDFIYNMRTATGANDISGGSGGGPKKIVNEITSAFSKLDAAKMALLGFSGAIVAFTISLSYLSISLGDAVKRFTEFPVAIVGAFKSIAGAFNGVKDYFRMKGWAKAITQAAIAITVMALALTGLTYLDGDKLMNASKAMSMVFGVMTAMLIVLSKFASRYQAAEKYNLMMDAFSKILLSLSGSIFLVAAALAVLSTVEWNKDTFMSLYILGGIMATLIVVIAAINALGPEIKTSGLWLIFYAGSVFLLVLALNKLADLKVDKLKSKLLTLAEAMAIVAGVAIASSKMTFGGGLGVMALIGSIVLMELALQWIIDYGIDQEDLAKSSDSIIFALEALGVLSFYMVVVSRMMKNPQGVAATIITIIIAMLTITWSLNKLAGNDPKKLAVAGGMLTLVLGAIMALIYIMGQVGQAARVKQSGTMMLKLAGALAIISLVITFLGSLPSEIVQQGFKAIAGIVAIMAALIYVTQYAGKIDPKSFIAMAGVIAALGLMVTLMSFVEDKDALLEAAGILGLALVAFGTAMYLATKEAHYLSYKPITTMILAIIAITISLLAILKVSEGKIDKVLAIAVALSGVLLALGICAKLIIGSFTTGNVNTNTIKKANATLLMMIAMFSVIGLMLSLLTLVTGTDSTTPLTAAGAIVAVMLAVALIIVFMEKALPRDKRHLDKLMKKLEAFSLLIPLLGAIGSALSAVMVYGDNSGEIMTAAGALALTMGAMLGVFYLLSKMGKSGNEMAKRASAFALASVALLPAAVALRILAGYNWSEILPAAVALGAVILSVAGALSLLTAVASTGVGGGLIMAIAGAIALVTAVLAGAALAIAKSIDMIVEAIRKLTEIEYDKIDIEKLFQLAKLLLSISAISIVTGMGLSAIGVGLGVIGLALLVIAGAMALVLISAVPLALALRKLVDSVTKLLEVITEMSLLSKEIATGITLIGNALGNTLSNIGASLALGFVRFVQVIVANSYIIGNALKVLIITAIDIMMTANKDITAKILEGLTEMFQMLEEKLPSFFEHLNNVIIEILKFLASQANVYGYYGAIIASEFVIGLAQGLAEEIDFLADTAAYLALRVIQAIKNTFDNYGSIISDNVEEKFSSGAAKVWRGLGKVANPWMKGWVNEQADFLEENAKAVNNSKTIVDDAIAGYEQRKAAREAAQAEIDAVEEGYNSADTSGAKAAAEKANGSIFEAGLGKVTDTINEYADKGKKAMGDVVGNIFDGGEEAIEESSEVQQKMVKKWITGLPDEAKKAMEESLAKEGWTKGAGDYMYKMIDVDEAGNKITENVSKTIGSIPSEALAAMKDHEWELNETGSQFVNSVVSGAEAKKDGLNGAFGDLVDFDALSEQYGIGGKDNGQQWVDGLGISLSDPFNQNKIGDLAANYGKIMNGSYTKETEIESPSKKTARYAGYWIDGLVLTLESTQRQNQVKQASISVAKNMTSSLATALQTSKSDNVLTPTIAPVIDDQNMKQYSGVLNTLTNPATMKLAADSTMTVHNSDQARLAAQIDNLSKEVDKLANKDFSDSFGKVRFNINANTTVDGKVLRRTASDYTIDQIDRKERAIIMSKGGRA